MTPKVDLDVPAYCAETAEGAAERAPGILEMLDEAKTVDSLDDGYRFVLPGEGGALKRAAEFALAERACCPMIDFTLAFSGPDEPVEMILRAPEQVLADMHETFELDERFELRAP